jgi:hypothetical protein
MIPLPFFHICSCMYCTYVCMYEEQWITNLKRIVICWHVGSGTPQRLCVCTVCAIQDLKYFRGRRFIFLGPPTIYLYLYVFMYCMYVCMQETNFWMKESGGYPADLHLYYMASSSYFFSKNSLHVWVCMYMYVCMCIHLSMYVHVILTIITTAIFIFFTKSRPASLSPEVH